MNPLSNRSARITRDGIHIHAARDFEAMRRAGQVAARILDDVCDFVGKGIKTIAIDRFVEDRIAAYGAKSATIGYRGYRHATCISVNHVVCHGIPGERVLRNGDILNVDVTVIVDGWHGDSSRMYVIGKASRKASRLMDVTHQALMKGLGIIRPGRTFGDLGNVIQRHVESHRMSVVTGFCGHGIGREFHQPPNVMHFGRTGAGPKFEQGMFFHRRTHGQSGQTWNQDPQGQLDRCDAGQVPVCTVRTYGRCYR